MKSGFLAVGVAVAGLLSVHARELKIEKLGTTCVGGVEANPLVYRGRLYHFESFRDSSKGRVWGPNRCGRFRDLEGDLNEPLAPAPKGLYFACAFVEGEKVVVTGVKSPGANHVLQCESTDLVHWTEPRAILSNATWRCYNTSICRAGGRYVMVYERGGSDPEVGSQFTMFFAESTDLRTWRTIPGAVFGREFYTGSPCLRYFGGYYYFLYLNNRFRMRIVRSKDLRSWETSPRVVLDFDENDRRLYPGIAFTDEEKERIRTSEDINASDFDMCEWKGDLIISYSWGNQRGKEFLALAKVRSATEREFCESFFDGPVSLRAGVSLPAEARPSEKYAAEEWCKWSAQVTGWSCAVVPEAEAGVVLRREDSLGEDAFRLTAEKGRLVVRGGRRGILYGVYDALERLAGIGWFSMNTTVVPKAAKIEMPAGLDVTERPAFELRQPFFYELSNDPDLSARLKVNAPQLQERHGGCSHLFDERLGNCHTFDWLVPPQDYFKDHPEYFSEIDGERTAHNAQLCLTNPDVLRIVTEKVLSRMRENPSARYFGVSANDNMRYCRCAKCAAIDAEEGSHAGTLLRFVNAVAEATEKEFPGKVIETLAYQHTRKPPRRTRARANVMPCFCSIECEFSTPLATSRNKENRAFMEDLRGWAAQTDQLYVWDYVINFANMTYPFPNVLVLQQNVKTFRDNKVKSLFEQGNNRYRHSDFAALKAYLLAKWMWNPDLPLEPMLEKFFPAYYGKAAPLVRRYFDELHALPRDPIWQPLNIYEGNTSPRIPDEFLDRMAKLWDRAEELVKDEPTALYNVRMERLGVDVARLMRHRYARERWGEYQALARKTLAAFEEGHVNLDEKLYNYGEMFGDWRKIATRTYAEMNADLAILRAEGFRKAIPLDRLFFTPGDRYTLQVHVKGGGFGAAAGVYDSHAELGGVKVDAKDVPSEGKWFDVYTWRVEPGEFVNFVLGPGAVADGIRLVSAGGTCCKAQRPLHVRYAWAKNPEGANLYNKEGPPACAFRR